MGKHKLKRQYGKSCDEKGVVKVIRCWIEVCEVEKIIGKDRIEDVNIGKRTEKKEEY